MKVYLADAIYVPSAVAGQPDYDELIGVCNPFTVPHQVLIHAIDNAGNEVAGSPLSYMLQPLDAVALSFIPTNGPTNPIAPFDGHIEIEFPDGVELPCGACISGGGANAPLPATPVNWNCWSPNVDVIGSGYPRGFPAMGTRYIFAYAIPYYLDPAMHFGSQTYGTSIKLTNKGTAPVSLELIYHPNRAYPNFGTTYSSMQTIAAGCALEKQLTELFPALAGLNNEGWVEVVVQPNGLVVTEPAGLLGYLLVSSVAYGQAPTQMGFSLSPFIVA